MSLPPELQQRFPDMTPIQKAPSMSTVNGVGTSFYGKRDYDPETGTYVGTHWVVFLFIPIIPLGAYRVADANPGWFFLGKVPMSRGPKIWPLFLLVVIGAIVGGVLFYRHSNHPDTIAGRELAQADATVQAGNLPLAAQAYQRLAEGKTGHAAAAREKLKQLVENPPDVDPNQLVGLFEVAVSCAQGGKLNDCYSHGVAQAAKVANKDPKCAWKILHAVDALAPSVRPVEERRLRQKVLETIVAEEPKNLDAIFDLAAVYDDLRDHKKAKDLLWPHKDKLGTSEGARVLGRVLVEEGNLDEAQPLLEAYANERLPAFKEAEDAMMTALRLLQNQVINELNTGKAPGYDHEAFKRATKEQQNAMDREYFQKRMKEDAAFLRAQAKMAQAARVVPVAFDLGIVLLRKGQAIADPVQRRKQLEKAEKTFLAVQGTEGKTDEFRLLMGQVYYWMGEHAKGRQHFDDFLKTHGHGADKVGMVCNLLRQVGATSEARTLVENTFAKEAPGEPKFRLARLRAVLFTDTDDEIAWLEKCDPNLPETKAHLLNARGSKALQDGHDAEAAGLFRQAIEAYGALPPTSVTFNDQALSYQALFHATGDAKVLDECIKLLEKAYSLMPRDSIAVQNFAEVLRHRIWHDLAAKEIDPKVAPHADARLLTFLYSDDKGLAAFQERFRTHPHFDKLCSHLDRLIVLAPKNVRPYQELFTIFTFVEDKKRVDALGSRLASADLDLKEQNRRELELHDEKKSAKRLEDLGRLIASAERKAKQARELGGTSLAAALDNLVTLRMGEIALGKKGDVDELLRQAEEAHKAAPSEGTRFTLLGVYILRAHQDLAQKNAAYGELAKKHGRAVGSMNLIALALDKEELRKDLQAQPDLKKAAALLTERIAAFPKQAYPSGWAILRHLDPAAAERLVAASKADAVTSGRRSITARLMPLNVSDAYASYWEDLMQGRPDEGRARLRALADQGISVLVP